MITDPRFAGPMPDVTGIALLIQAVSAALFLVGVVALPAVLPARRPRRRRLSRGGDAHRRLRRDPLLLLPGRLRRAGDDERGTPAGVLRRPARWASTPSRDRTCGHCAPPMRRSIGCASPRRSARRWKSGRGSPASCTTAWRRTCGSPSSSTSGSSRTFRTSRRSWRWRSPRRSTRPSRRRSQAVVTMRAADERERPLERAACRARSRTSPHAQACGPTSRPRTCPTRYRPRPRSSCCASFRRRSPTCASTPTPRSCALPRSSSGGALHLVVHDNGRGFRPEETSGEGLGVQGMKERARLMGGELRVMSQPSGGTTVDLVVPLRANVGRA